MLHADTVFTLTALHLCIIATGNSSIKFIVFFDQLSVDLPVSDDIKRQLIVIGRHLDDSQHVDVATVVTHCYRLTI